MNGLLTWTDGTMSGTGRTLANGGMVFGNGSTRYLDARRFDNAGVANWTDTGGEGLILTNGAVFTNLAGATLLFASSAFTSPLQGVAPATFNNAGLVEKTVPGTSRLNISLNNTGTVEVEAGWVTLQRGGSKPPPPPPPPPPFVAGATLSLRGVAPAKARAKRLGNGWVVAATTTATGSRATAKNRCNRHRPG